MKLSGEDLSRYSNNIESAGLRVSVDLKSDVTITNISQSLSHIMAGKQLVQTWYEVIASLSLYVYAQQSRS